MPSLCRCFHPCLKADRSASGNERRSIWLLPHVPTQSRHECEEGISSHHSQETRHKPSQALQVRSFLLQSILHPVGRQFPYELDFSVLLPTWIFRDSLVVTRRPSPTLCLACDVSWEFTLLILLTLRWLTRADCSSSQSGVQSTWGGPWGPLKEFVRLSLIQWCDVICDWVILCVSVKTI